MERRLRIWTIGHSTHSIADFIDALKSFGIEVLADVRSFPGSRRYPHFNSASLQSSLINAGIEYFLFKELGGRRRAHSDSHNVAWRNESFRGYADYMETDSFKQGIERLLAVARAKRSAVMCSEAVWWRCHRSMIADYLKATNLDVIHIMGVGKSAEHPFTSAARIVNGELSYRGVLETAG